MTAEDNGKIVKVENSCRNRSFSVILIVCSLYLVIYNYKKPSDIFPTVSRGLKRQSFNTPVMKDILKSHGMVEYIKRKSDDLTLIPKIIFMLWDSGWSGAPLMQTNCLESFRRMNPDFNIITLNISMAEQLINRPLYYSDSAWDSAAIQAKSDIIRVELLAKYGGIWADATVYCNQPLINWLNDSMLAASFLSYERKESSITEQLTPWISTWFLASTQDSYIIQTWRDVIRKDWTKTPIPSYSEYFWVHRIFTYLVKNDTKFRSLYKMMPLLDAGGPHCHYKSTTTPYVYKIKAPRCKAVRDKLLK